MRAQETEQRVKKEVSSASFGAKIAEMEASFRTKLHFFINGMLPGPEQMCCELVLAANSGAGASCVLAPLQEM